MLKIVKKHFIFINIYSLDCWPPTSLLANKMGVFATDTVGHLEFPGTKGTFGYNIVRKK